MIIAQIIFTIFTYCCLNNLSEKRLKIRAIQNTVVLKIKIVMPRTPFLILSNQYMQFFYSLLLFTLFSPGIEFLPSLVLLSARDNKFINK